MQVLPSTNTLQPQIATLLDSVYLQLKVGMTRNFHLMCQIKSIISAATSSVEKDIDTTS